MRGNVIETVMGAVVLVIAALFLFFAYSTSQVGAVTGGYPVTAQFQSVDGIHAGSDVRIGGVKVGSVSSEFLDPKTFTATLKMTIASEYKLPDDTVAEITSSSLLGDKYVSLVPGGSDKDLPAGGQIKFTQSSVSLENLIGQMIFSQPGGGQKKPGEGGEAAPGGLPGSAIPGGGLPGGRTPGGAAPDAVPGGLK
ncbi:MAG TPA: outer membrane lipid asymmetry maintenance protein MlaD [Stellaceae bacterium]|nr:outer membrane lipid asymmetry maintenance protein MlaD [Stellaceae bacterium]